MLSSLAFLLTMTIFAGCSGPAVPRERHGIITMAPHLTETVFELGQGARVIAVGKFDDFPPEVTALPKVGGYLDPELEKIALLSPELLILPGKHPKVTEFAELQGLRVLNVHMDNLATIDEGVATIAAALGCTPQAGTLRAKLKTGAETLHRRYANLPRPKTLLITTRKTHDLNTLLTAGGPSFVSELVDLAGGQNIFADSGKAYLEASKEEVVLRAPEVILEFHCAEPLSHSEQQQYIDDWKALPSLPAVKNNQVHIILAAHAMRPGPRILEIAELLGQLLHPVIEKN